MPSIAAINAAAGNRLGLRLGELLRGQPCAATGTEQVRGRRAPEQAAREDRMNLVLGPGALAHQGRAACHSPPQRLSDGVGDPDRIEHPRVQQTSQGAGIETIGLDPGMGDRPHVLGVGDDYAGDVGLENPGDLHLRGRGMRPIEARVALARYACRLAHRMLQTQEPFDEER